MATEVANLVARLGVDRSDFDRNLASADAKFSRFGSSVKKGALAAGAAIATGLGVTAKIGWDEFKQGQLVAAQTNAVLESTKGVANVTAREIDSLATSLMKKSGVDDEAIKTGQNMLLTFKQIRNESGKGNDVFNQATKATLDLSVAMGKDMKDASIMVGKALNDPIKGITAMRRVGIQFTQAQEDSIKAMVASGDVMGAQKLILRELESQFGGSAEAAGKTLPGQLNILKESFSNFAGELVGNAIPKLLAVVGFFREHTTLAKAAGIAVGAFTVALLAGGAALFVYNSALGKGVGALVKYLFITKNAAGATRVMAAAQWLLNTALLANPIGLIVLALIGLGVALVVAWKKSETFRKIVTGAWDAIKAGAVTMKVGIARAWDAIQNAVRGSIGFVLELFKKYLGGIALILHAMGKMPGPLGAPFRVGAKAVDGLIGKVDDLQGGLSRMSNRKYGIRFVTNAARVKSDIEDMRSGLPGRSGDVRYLDIAPSRAMGGVDSRLFGALGLAQQLGLNVSSTYRPGATVAGSGSRSDHSYFPSKAVDFAGSTSTMARFARAVTRLSGIDTVIHSPVGLWRGGFWGPISSAVTKRDHYDHVHVDTFDRGGWLPPRSATLAINRTSQWEPVGPPGRSGLTVNVNVGNWFGSDRESARKLATFLLPHIDRAVRMNTGHA